MKVKVTKKSIKDNYNIILGIDYCNAQYLLHFESPKFYSCGVYGWACDYYEIGSDFIISTGFNYIDNTNNNYYELVKEYEKKAEKILHNNLDYKTQKSKVTKLLMELCEKVAKKELPWWEF